MNRIVEAKKRCLQPGASVGGVEHKPAGSYTKGGFLLYEIKIQHRNWAGLSLGLCSVVG